MTLEYCSNGDLFNLVKTSGKLSENLSRYIFSQLLDGVEYLHKEGKVSHLDLKLENVLIDDELSIKLCDFGFIEDI
jgi:serine/threonine protein kinase